MQNNDLTRRFAALLCTVVMSATCVIGAVGPAHALGSAPVAARVACTTMGMAQALVIPLLVVFGVVMAALWRINPALPGPGAVLVCGRYEGLDQRFIDEHVDEQISLGDFVLSGGEIAAMAMLDAVARLQPGVLGDADSHAQDSFNPALDGLLDCPHYTRPETWEGQGVPEVLLSGHHGQIERWRREQRLALTIRLRPELIDRARAAGRLSRQDEAFLAGLHKPAA